MQKKHLVYQHSTKAMTRAGITNLQDKIKVHTHTPRKSGLLQQKFIELGTSEFFFINACKDDDFKT